MGDLGEALGKGKVSGLELGVGYEATGPSRNKVWTKGIKVNL